MPLIDKAVEFPTVYKGDGVSVQLNLTFLMAQMPHVTTLRFENINITSAVELPPLPLLETLYVQGHDSMLFALLWVY